MGRFKKLLSGYALLLPRRSASMTLVRISLIRVRWPGPLDFSHSSTSPRTYSEIIFFFSRRSLASRNRVIAAICSSLGGGISEWSICESSPDACRSAVRRTVSRSRLVSGLLKISSAFTLVSVPRRDDRVPALLARFLIDPVFFQDTASIGKHAVAVAARCRRCLEPRPHALGFGAGTEAALDTWVADPYA